MAAGPTAAIKALSAYGLTIIKYCSTGGHAFPFVLASQTSWVWYDDLSYTLQAELPTGDPESKDEVEADTSGDEAEPVDSGHKARDEMFCAVASVRVGY